MNITPLAFTGISNFSEDFQTILSRSVRIASVPLAGLQNDQLDLLSRKQLLSEFQAAVAELGAAVSDLGRFGETKAIQAVVSNTSRVSVSVSGAPGAGSHTITDISSVAKAASGTTVAGYATADQTAVSADGTLQLVVGEQTYTVDLTGAGENNLYGLRDAINAIGAGVSAAVLNTGTGLAPYYLSVSAEATGLTPIELRETAGEPASNFLTATNPGANAVFKLDGLDVVKSDNSIGDVIPGLTFTILSTTLPGEEVTVRLSSSRSALAGALERLASSYNDVSSLVSGQFGPSAGVLSGDALVREIQASMRALTNYTAAGAIQSLADLGIELDDQGRMSFNSSTLNALSDTAVAESFDFLGSASSGFGAVAGRFTVVSDPLGGLIKLRQDQYDAADARLEAQMNEITNRIDLMQTGLARQLQQADVLLASLESQQQMLDASIQSLNLALFGKKEG